MLLLTARKSLLVNTIDACGELYHECVCVYYFHTCAREKLGQSWIYTMRSPGTIEQKTITGGEVSAADVVCNNKRREERFIMRRIVVLR